MEQKSIKKLPENYIFFWHDLETTFSRSWDDFGGKNLPKIRGSLFRRRGENAKSLFWNDPPSFSIFSAFNSSI